MAPDNVSPPAPALVSEPLVAAADPDIVRVVAAPTLIVEVVAAVRVKLRSVEAVEPVAAGLEVTFDVEEWVAPTEGSSSVVFLADDPAKEVGAPRWKPSVEKVLVVASTDPTRPYSLEHGESAVSQWRKAGSPVWPEDRCDDA